MKSCPKCKGRATKIINLTENMVKCQQCGHKYPWLTPEQEKVSEQALRELAVSERDRTND